MIKESEFIQHYASNASQIMWFLGAGTSRSAGMPTATDIIWDLKRVYYCRQEGQDIKRHDVNKQTIKDKIQQYLDSKSFPSLWSAEEYSFYFELSFKSDYAAQQNYLQKQLAPERISLNVGQRALAALIQMGKARILFTTNFDNVIETAYSHVTGKALNAFHLEGSYAAQQALNQEQFPIYAKLHGDFRYTSLKNLSDDLKANDAEIQKCFLNACNRYGMIVVGYSGRDQNVMDMFNAALDAGNPFPQGLFWAVPPHATIDARVATLIAKAQSKGVKADIVEIDTFDSLLARIWLQTSERPQSLDEKVRAAKNSAVNIPFAAPSKNSPILKTNALEVTGLPASCKVVRYTEPATIREIREAQKLAQTHVIFAKTNEILAWGSESDITKALGEDKITAINLEYDLSAESALIPQSTVLQAFYEEGIATALCYDKPLRLRRSRSAFFIAVDLRQEGSSILQPLKSALAFNGRDGRLGGIVPKLADTKWMEAVEVRFESRNGKLWLLLRPDIWITPMTNREQSTMFLRAQKLYRYNPKSNAVLDAWIQILLGSAARGTEVSVSLPPADGLAASFTINNCPAFSGRG